MLGTGVATRSAAGGLADPSFIICDCFANMETMGTTMTRWPCPQKSQRCRPKLCPLPSPSPASRSESAGLDAPAFVTIPASAFCIVHPHGVQVRTNRMAAMRPITRVRVGRPGREQEATRRAANSPVIFSKSSWANQRLLDFVRLTLTSD